MPTAKKKTAAKKPAAKKPAAKKPAAKKGTKKKQDLAFNQSISRQMGGNGQHDYAALFSGPPFNLMNS